MSGVFRENTNLEDPYRQGNDAEVRESKYESHGDSPHSRPRSSPRSTRKPASPDAEGDGKFSLRDLLGLSPEVAREIARAGSEGIPSNGFSASREAGFGVFRGLLANHWKNKIMR